MATVLMKGERVRSRLGYYEVTRDEELGMGGFAITYEARSDRGERIFLKQYHSPSSTLAWYRGFIEYQDELKQRIEASAFSDFSYRFVEFFEFDGCYFQAFEFVEGGKSLRQLLDEAAAPRGALPWERRLIMARVMMGGIKTLHQTQIVHSDLKPENIILMPTEAVSGYRLKVIDLDFSLLADRRAPWHGYEGEGYRGTPNYLSPEHVRGEVPQFASDVFTCGLMLYELLADGHPYRNADLNVYRERVLAGRAAPPTLPGAMPAGNDEAVRTMIHRCLAVDPSLRPSAAELHAELCRRAGSSAPPAPVPPPVASPVEPADDVLAEELAAPPEEAPAATGRIVLQAESGQRQSFGVAMAIGSRLCRQFGDDARYWAEPQFSLQRDGDGWYVEPAAGTPNQTMLNGRAVTRRERLSEGDVLAVGREEKGIVKLPLTVSFE